MGIWSNISFQDNLIGVKVDIFSRFFMFHRTFIFPGRRYFPLNMKCFQTYKDLNFSGFFHKAWIFKGIFFFRTHARFFQERELLKLFFFPRTLVFMEFCTGGGFCEVFFFSIRRGFSVDSFRRTYNSEGFMIGFFTWHGTSKDLDF